MSKVIPDWLSYSDSLADWLFVHRVRVFVHRRKFLYYPIEKSVQKNYFHERSIYLPIPSLSLQEAKDKFKGWVSQPWYDNSVEISYKKVKDGYPLRLWRCVVEVNASPDDVIKRILYER